MKRLFIALPIEKKFLKAIEKIEKRIEKKIGFKSNWIPLKNLHLTIIFLGYLSDEDFLKVKEIFNRLKFEPLKLKILKIDYGPPKTKRMIWIYLEKNKKLEEIKNFFENELKRENINYKKEKRELLPHINLARLKKQRNFPEIKEDINQEVEFNEIVLYQSILKKEGAEYLEISKFKHKSPND